jgi:hypothetical protein
MREGMMRKILLLVFAIFPVAAMADYAADIRDWCKALTSDGVFWKCQEYSCDVPDINQLANGLVKCLEDSKTPKPSPQSQTAPAESVKPECTAGQNINEIDCECKEPLVDIDGVCKDQTIPDQNTGGETPESLGLTQLRANLATAREALQKLDASMAKANCGNNPSPEVAAICERLAASRTSLQEKITEIEASIEAAGAQ